MKFGVRKPSLKRRISARTSPKRFVRHNLGLKAPKGFGIVTNPNIAIYNKVYNKTSVSADKLLKSTQPKLTTNHLNIGTEQSYWRRHPIISLLGIILFWPYILVYVLLIKKRLK